MISSSVYLNIRNEVVAKCSQCTEQDIKSLKDFFAHTIKSTRRLDMIKSVDDLVHILEKRDVLNEHNISCFGDIAQALNKYDLIELMNLYSAATQRSNVMPAAQAPVLNHHPAAARERIHELISNEIGKKWKDLARALDISEGKIDELEERYKCISERIREILLHHERNYTEAWTWYPLLTALGKSRRNDLRDKVQKILST